MAALENTIAFIAATALIALAWFAYLWLNNLISRMPGSPLQELAGGALSFGLFVSLGIVLYFFALPLAMGVVVVSTLASIIYTVRPYLPRIKTRPQ